MFTTAVRIEHDLGVPSVSLNALTGHRSCTPEDCSGLVANPPQGSVPVSGVFPAGAILHLLETRLQAIRLSPYRADLPARHPVRLGMNCRFPGMLFSPATLSRPGQPSDPETSPLVSARCAGDTPVRFMAHRLHYGHSVAIGLAPLRRSHVRLCHTSERDLGAHFVPLNILTGYRSQSWRLHRPACHADTGRGVGFRRLSDGWTIASSGDLGLGNSAVFTISRGSLNASFPTPGHDR